MLPGGPGGARGGTRCVGWDEGRGAALSLGLPACGLCALLRPDTLWGAPAARCAPRPRPGPGPP